MLGWDVGQRRLGVARAHSQVRIPQALAIIELDGSEVVQLQKIIDEVGPAKIIVGLSAGDQARWTKDWLANLRPKLNFGGDYVWQSEALTTVRARELSSSRRVDDLAACFILEDYLND